MYRKMTGKEEKNKILLSIRSIPQNATNNIFFPAGYHNVGYIFPID